MKRQNEAIVTEIKEEKAKAVPFPVKRGWTGVPNSIFTVYSKHPEMNSTALLVYGYLLHRYNEKFGYAFPSQGEMAIDLGVSPRTIKAAVAKLKKVGLIETEISRRFNNNCYFFPPVCETIEELKERFPEITDHLAELDKKAGEIRAEMAEEKDRLAMAYRRERISKML